MRQLIGLIVVILVAFVACSPGKRSRDQIQRLESAPGHQNYEIGIACMQYILQEGDDLSYSKTLIKKLLDIGFPAEAIYAAEWLLKEYPNDGDLLCFRGIGYRELHQYDLSQNDLARAVTLQPDNSDFVRQARITSEQHRRWIEIQSLGHALAESSDSLDVLLKRAEQFFILKEYDAVLYDLGSVSKMATPADSVYYARKVSTLYTESRKPVETLTEMLKYFKKD